MKILTKLLLAIKGVRGFLFNKIKDNEKVKLFFHYRNFLLHTVIIPTIIFGLYIMVVSPDRWVAESKVIVKSISLGNDNANPLSFVMGEFSSGGREDSFFLKEYIYSFDMFEYLNEKLDLRRLYSQGIWDPFFRLFNSATKEDALKYYKSRISVVLEENSGILTIATQGFNSKDAQIINRTILERSEWFLNDISHKIARSQSSFFEEQIKLALERMNEAQQAIIDFQTQNDVIHPLIQADSGTKLVAKLMEKLTSQETQLKALKAYLSDNSPQVISQVSKIAALKDQIDQERKFIAGGDKQALNSIFLKFQNLEINAKLAEQLYKSTVVSLEKNNLNAAKQFKSLVIISSPTLPEEPLLPQRVYNWILFFVVILAIYGSTKLILISIREHI